MSAHDGLPRHKFGDVEFPGTTTRLRIPFRHHIHEYPHSPGGSPEKLGRGLARVSIVVGFHATLPQYPGLYPDGMLKILGYATQMATLPLRHPTAGEFPAFITNWDQDKDARVRSGEKVEIEFLEDQSASFAIAAISDLNHITAIGPTAAQLATDLAATQADLALTPTDISLFDALQLSVNSVLAVKDTAQLYGNRYADSLTQMTNLCQQINDLQSMQDARAWPVIDVLRDLQALGIKARNDLLAEQIPMKRYVVPFTQTLTQVAITLYGDASKQSDLLSLNQIDDPMNVRAGKTIRYYPSQQPLTSAA